MKVTKAFIPVAGYGTRFLPQTKAFPKEMLPIIDTPALQLILEEAAASGITDVMLLISPAKTDILKHFSKNVELEQQLVNGGNYEGLAKIQKADKIVNLTFAVQQKMEGTAKALKYCEKWVNNEPFAVLFGDDIIINEAGDTATKQLIDAYEKTGTSIIGVQQMPEEIARRCGVMEVVRSKGKFHEISGLVEKPPKEIPLPSNLTSLGRFLLTPDVFPLIDKTPLAKNGEAYMTDTLAMLAKTAGIYAYEFDGRRYDTGNKLGFLIANIEFALKNPETDEGLKSYLKELVKGL